MTELELDAVAKIPEIIKTPERVLGRYETVELPPSAYVKMSQVRGERNKVTEELKDSIESQGLISPIHVARMTAANLAEYINFVNHVWGSETVFEQFIDQQQADGYFYLVIDGHPRHQAIIELEEEGRLEPSLVAASVHTVRSPEDIIRLQLDANIHSQPPRERRAIALVESYEWGLTTGRWKNHKEYVERNVGISSLALSEALAFSELPATVRNYVLAGHVPYAGGVALGRLAPDIKERVMLLSGLDDATMTKSERELFQKAVHDRLMVEVNFIAEKHLNSTAAEKRLKSTREAIRRKNDLIKNPENPEEHEEHQQDVLFEFGLKSASDLLCEDIAASQRALAEFMRDYARRPSVIAGDLIQLGAHSVEPKLLSEVLADFELANERAGRFIGSRALSAEISPPDTGLDGFEELAIV